MNAFLFTILIWASSLNLNLENQTKIELINFSNIKQNTDTKKNCIECHEKLTTKKVAHPVKENCKGCHQPNGNKHPNDSVKGFIFSEKVSLLCYNCHKFDQAEKVLHKPATDGDCLSCHDAHQSEHPKLLLKEDKELCLSCHDKTVTFGNRKIANIKQLLKKGNFVHSVIDSSGCSTCHSPHVSDNSRRLVKYFPGGEEYLQASVDSFALCFSCHDSKLFEDADTRTATNFRNGNENLHYVHVNRKKSRNCSMCHNIHGSVNKHLINHTVMFGNWEMPMDYKWYESGGSCNNGCHAEKKYDRIKKIIQKSDIQIAKLEKQKKFRNPNKENKESTDKQIVYASESNTDSIPQNLNTKEKNSINTTENLIIAENEYINKENKKLTNALILKTDSVSKDIAHNNVVDDVFFENINFVYAKTELVGGMEKILLKLINYLKKYTGFNIEIRGHTDNVGSDAYNLVLAKQRAEKIKELLIEQGINQERIQIVAFGEKKPLATNKNVKGRAKNRRTEFKLIEKN